MSTLETTLSYLDAQQNPATIATSISQALRATPSPLTESGNELTVTLTDANISHRLRLEDRHGTLIARVTEIDGEETVMVGPRRAQKTIGATAALSTNPLTVKASKELTGAVKYLLRLGKADGTALAWGTH